MGIRPVSGRTDTGADLLKRQQALYEEMDRIFRRAAATYQFVCTGCDDNCCRTRFYHHTIMEYSYLYQGMRQMSLRQQTDIRARAAECVRVERRNEPGMASEIFWCPLNDQGRCLLYAYRPMICRLHGLPHELTTPGKGKSMGPGCHAFVSKCGNLPYYPLDRTPLYRRLAEIEQAARQLVHFQDRIRLTIAGMIDQFPQENSDE